MSVETIAFFTKFSMSKFCNKADRDNAIARDWIQQMERIEQLESLCREVEEIVHKAYLWADTGSVAKNTLQEALTKLK